MIESNGRPAERRLSPQDEAELRAYLAGVLPLTSDRFRGWLRTWLIETRMVTREGITPRRAEKGGAGGS